MIRAKLRLLAKLTLQMKVLNPVIKSLDDALTPVHYDNYVQALNFVAQV